MRRLADVAVVTSDNPRSEDPAAIIADITAGFAMDVEVDRRLAIERAVGMAAPGDVVVIAGKGHEQGQELADRTDPLRRPRRGARGARGARRRRVIPLSTREIAALTGGVTSGAGVRVTGVAIDSRAVEPGDLFVALPGERTHGARFVDAAVAAGRRRRPPRA